MGLQPVGGLKAEAIATARRLRRQRNLNQIEIPEEDVTISEEVLGKGGFGTVFIADYNGRNAAAKVRVPWTLAGKQATSRALSYAWRQCPFFFLCTVGWVPDLVAVHIYIRDTFERLPPLVTLTSYPVFRNKHDTQYIGRAPALACSESPLNRVPSMK